MAAIVLPASSQQWWAARLTGWRSTIAGASPGATSELDAQVERTVRQLRDVYGLDLDVPVVLATASLVVRALAIADVFAPERPAQLNQSAFEQLDTAVTARLNVHRLLEASR